MSLRERIALYAFLTALTALSIDAILPGLRGINTQLASSSWLLSQHVISLFIFGMVFGELFFGPISDAIGRKKSLLIGLAVYAVGALVAAAATSIEMLVVGRFLQGIGVAGPKITTRAMIRDQFEGEAMARILSLMFSLIVLVPLLAPLLGQGLIALTGWRGVFWAYLVVALVLGIWFAVRQPETLTPSNRIAFQPKRMLQNTTRILRHRTVLYLIIATGFIFGAQLLYLSTAADLFFDAYDIAETFPAYFAVLALGMGLASYLNAKLVGRFGMDLMTRTALVCLVLLSGLLLLAASYWQGSPPLSVFLSLAFCQFFAIGISFGNLNAIAMRPLGQIAGLGASLIAAGSSLLATGFALLFGATYDGSVYYLAAAFLLAGITALGFVSLGARANLPSVQPV